MIKTSSTFLVLALISLLLAILGGTLSSLYYIPSTYPWLKQLGIHMFQARSIHTTFGVAWIYLGAISVVYKYLEGPKNQLSPNEKKRANFQILSWIAAGAGIFISFGMKVFSGRGYIEYHPMFSILILGGWIAFAWNVIARIIGRFWESPVYIYMWTVSCLLFIYTYVEGHLWMFKSIRAYPIVDIQLQWKSLGAMAGSFNLLVYGAGVYIAEQISGSKKYAQSKMAFCLFGIGLLNSFTNYAHHTYHLPQNHLIKWISFIVSMLEILILARVMFDLVNVIKSRKSSSLKYNETTTYLISSKWWTFINLGLAILISIPPINTIIHGTYVVAGHAMGTMIGIDSFILFAGASWILTEQAIAKPYHYRIISLLNFSFGLLLFSLTLSGAIQGFYRYMAWVQPEAFQLILSIFPVSGLICAMAMSLLSLRWLKHLYNSTAAL